MTEIHRSRSSAVPDAKRNGYCRLLTSTMNANRDLPCAMAGALAGPPLCPREDNGWGTHRSLLVRRHAHDLRQVPALPRLHARQRLRLRLKVAELVAVELQPPLLPSPQQSARSLCGTRGSRAARPPETSDESLKGRLTAAGLAVVHHGAAPTAPPCRAAPPSFRARTLNTDPLTRLVATSSLMVPTHTRGSRLVKLWNGGTIPEPPILSLSPSGRCRWPACLKHPSGVHQRWKGECTCARRVGSAQRPTREALLLASSRPEPCNTGIQQRYE